MAVQSRQSLLAKVEAVYGTDPTPVGTDAVPMIGDATLSAVTENGEIVPIDAFLDGYNHVEGTLFLTMSFSAMLKGSGAAGTAPEIGPLLKACGMSETVDAGVSVTYAPASVFNAAPGYHSATLYLDDGVHQWQIHGCYGTWSLESGIAGSPMLSFEFSGLYEIPTDGAVTSPTYEATRPVATRGLTFNIGGSSARCSQFSMDLNREVHPVRSMAETYGIAGFELGRADVKGRWTFAEQTIATKDWWTPFQAGTVQDFSWVWGGTAGNIVTLARPAGNTIGGVKFDSLSRGEDNGVITHEMGFSMGRHAGEDTFSLAFS